MPHTNIEKYKFEECDTCRAKPGSPTLCSGCLRNRATIEDLHALINKAEAEGYKKGQEYCADSHDLMCNMAVDRISVELAELKRKIEGLAIELDTCCGKIEVVPLSDILSLLEKVH